MLFDFDCILLHWDSYTKRKHISVHGLVVMIVACQVMDPGSIPGERIFLVLFVLIKIIIIRCQYFYYYRHYYCYYYYYYKVFLLLLLYL